MEMHFLRIQLSVFEGKNTFRKLIIWRLGNSQYSLNQMPQTRSLWFYAKILFKFVIGIHSELQESIHNFVKLKSKDKIKSHMVDSLFETLLFGW